MRTLNQIEPGAPIDHLPFKISSSGRYCLSKNVVMPSGGDGITVTADNVTIDLRGFAITSTNSAGNAIIAAQKNLAVLNGTIRNCGRGVYAFSSTNSILENLRVTDCNADGIDLGEGSLVRSCVAANNNEKGIYVARRSAVIDCTCTANDAGIQTGADSTVSRCTTSGNGHSGIATGAGCTVESCTSNANVEQGIVIDAGSAVRNCTVRGNQASGILVNTGGCVVVGNTCDSNHVHGIYVLGNICRVEANSCTSNTQFGLFVPGHHNLVIRNNFSNNPDGPWNLSDDTVYGALVTDLAGGPIPDSVGANANFQH